MSRICSVGILAQPECPIVTAVHAQVPCSAAIVVLVRAALLQLTPGKESKLSAGILLIHVQAKACDPTSCRCCVQGQSYRAQVKSVHTSNTTLNHQLVANMVNQGGFKSRPHSTINQSPPCHTVQTLWSSSIDQQLRSCCRTWPHKCFYCLAADWVKAQ